jgi:replication factor C subunit 1
MEHPIAFHCVMDLGKAPKKLIGGPAPDVEEAFEVDCFFLVSYP